MAWSSCACCQWPVQVLLSKDEQSRQRVAAQAAELEAEVDLLKQFDHPNIVRYLVRSWQLPVIVCSSTALLNAIALAQPAAADHLSDVATASDCTLQADAWLHKCAALQTSYLHSPDLGN